MQNWILIYFVLVLTTFGSTASASESSFKWHTLTGLIGSKQPQDLGIQGHVGARLGANLAFAPHRKSGFGFQFGSAFDYAGAASGVMQAQVGTRSRSQIFSTGGLFLRKDSWTMGAAYDFQYQNYYKNYVYHQARFEFEFTLNEKDSIGFSGSIGLNSEESNYTSGLFSNDITLEPLARGNIFWKRNWLDLNQVRVWVGISEGHGRFIQALQNVTTPATGPNFTYGGDFHIPLSDCIALVGRANFILPHDSGAVDTFFGINIYPGENAKTTHTDRFAPYMPVASNSDFVIDLRKR